MHLDKLSVSPAVLLYSHAENFKPGNTQLLTVAACQREQHSNLLLITQNIKL